MNKIQGSATHILPFVVLFSIFTAAVIFSEWYIKYIVACMHARAIYFYE